VKEILKQYAAYNVWANQRMIEVILNLPPEQQQQTVSSSFPSLEKTLLHMWDAESIWWQRIKLQEVVVPPSLTAKYNVKDITTGLANQDKQWFEWVNAATDAALDHVFAYRNTKKEQFKQPVFQMLLHLFNHATYHRGQLTTIFHHLEINKIPPTDFIVFSRASVSKK
jgi:uncharacterized damage-inducible protein DinB